MNPKAITFVLFASVLALCLAISPPLRAQVAGATLTGAITDAQGGVIANARVSAKNVATGLSTDTTTNSSGAYSIANLNPATYDVTVSAQGFSTAVRKMTLTVGGKQEMNLALTVGQVEQVIEVTGAAPTVETTNATLSGNVVGSQIVELPLNGRDWASLATLQPGVAGVRTQELVTQVGSIGRGLGSQLSIDGNRPTQNTYRLNGIIINDYSNAGPGDVLGKNLGVDAIQEFSVITSNYSAEYGYTSGGVVNAITKSGTNQLHGTAFEFLRNSALDAPSYFENATGSPKAPFRQNQFGASAGAPIKKDKIFAFGAYEGLRYSKGIQNLAQVPTANARLGILNAPDGSSLPVLNGPCPFANETNLAPGRASQCVATIINNPAKLSQSFMTFFPSCGSASPIGPANNTCFYSFSGAQVVPENYANTRGDVKLSEKDSLTASWYYDHSIFTQPDSLNQLSAAFIIGRQGASLEETHVFNSSTVNTARLGFNRTYGFGTTTNIKAINPAAADSTSFAIEPGLFAPRITGIGGGNGVPGLANFSGGFNGTAQENFTHQTVQLYDDARKTLGTHNLNFGGMFIRLEEKLYAPFTSDGSAQFNSLSDFLQDIPLKVQSPPVGGLAAVSPHFNFTSIVAGYFEDDWKLRSNLTLNLGLRYEMETIPTEKYGKIANLPAIFTNPGGNLCPNCSKVYFSRNPTRRNFEPRIGFAWDPFRNGKTSVRGGFGIFDALPLPYELALNNAQTSPFHVNSTVPGCNFAPANSKCVDQGQFPLFANLAGGGTAFFASPPVDTQTWNYVEPRPKRNYIYQWNLNVQRQVTGSLSVTVAYAGSRAIHNPFQMDDIGTVYPTHTSAGWLFPRPVGSGCLPGPPDCSVTDVALGLPASYSANPTAIVPGLLINPNAHNGIQTTIWVSKSWYNALQIGVEKRMSHGLQVQGSFTWSKTMDTSSGSFAGDNFAGDVTPTIPWWDLKIIKGLSDFQVGRNLVINALWQVPTPAAFGGPAGWMARGWGMGGILELSDGVPTWPLDGLAGDPMGQINSEPLAIPNVVPGCSLVNASSGRHGNLQYINPNCLINAVAPAGFDPSHTKCDQAFITNFHNNNPTLPPLDPNTCINLLGNLGRNTIIGPGLFNLDYFMSKDNKITRISESFDIQFRAEFFNILNHPNFAPPVDNLQARDANGVPISGFGQLTRLQTPGREIQFALKVIW